MTRIFTASLLILSIQSVQADIQIGSVAIYSDGSVEKLIQKGEEWTLWEDERKRLYKKANYPAWPVLKYQKFPDRSEGYVQKLAFGEPQTIKPTGKKKSVTFEFTRTSNDAHLQRYWRCLYDGKGSFTLGSKKYRTLNYDCTRYVMQKVIYPKPREEQRIKYSPTLGLVVDRRSVDYKGRSERLKLERLLSPEKATAKRIGQTVYAIRND